MLIERIPGYFIKKVIDDVGKDAIKLVTDKLKYKIEDIVEEIIRESLLEKSAKEVRAYVFKSQYQRLKTRWYSAIEKQIKEGSNTKKKKEIMAEIEKIKAFSNEEERKAILNKVYGVDTYEELIELRRKEILDWKENPDAKISEYRYILEKTKKQIENAVQIDLTLTICKILIDQFNGDLRNIIVGEPDIIVNNPIKAEMSGRLNLSNEVMQFGENEYAYEEYKVESDQSYKFYSLYDKTLLSHPNVSSRNMKSIDKFDRRILTEVLKNQTLDFARDRKIYVDILQIAREVYSSDNSSRYDMVVSRLIKMSLIRFATLEDDLLSVFGIFDHVEIDLANRGRKAVITVNEKVHQQIVDDKIIRIYGDKIKDLELEVSENIVLFLQKNRMNWHLSGYEEQHRILTYDSFLYRMRFDSRRKKAEIMKMIIESLEEFVQKEIILSGFKRKGDLFYLDYIPFEDYEIEDLRIVSTPRIELPEIIELPEGVDEKNLLKQKKLLKQQLSVDAK